MSDSFVDSPHPQKRENLRDLFDIVSKTDHQQAYA